MAYTLDGAAFPQDPLIKRWTRSPIAVVGTQENVYAAFWSIELSFGILSRDEVSFFEQKWNAGGLHSVTLPHPATGVLTGFTGVAIRSFEYTLNDIDRDSWAEDGSRLLLARIHLGATGT